MHKKPAKKFGGNYHKCGKKGHKAADCRSNVDIRLGNNNEKGKGKEKQEKSKAVVNLTNGKLSSDLSELDLCAVVLEVNLIGSNPQEWWYDTGATKHICSDRGMFTTYKLNHKDEQLFMGTLLPRRLRARERLCCT